MSLLGAHLEVNVKDAAPNQTPDRMNKNHTR